MPKPTVEATCAIPLRVHALVRQSREYPDGLLRAWGNVVGNPFDIHLQVTLDSAGMGAGTLRVQHAAFQHLTVPVPAQDYALPLEALPCRFGGVRWYARCPVTGARAAVIYLPNGAARFASRSAYGLASSPSVARPGGANCAAFTVRNTSPTQRDLFQRTAYDEAPC